MSTPDAIGETKYYRSHYSQWCCLHLMLRCATNPRQKTAAAFCFWRADTNFIWFSTVAHVQCRQTLAVASQRVRCRHSVANLSRRTDRRPSTPWVLSSTGKLIWYLHGSHFLPYHSADVFRFCFFNRHLCSVTSLGCSLNAVSSTSWVDTPLTADWLQVCFDTRPRLSF